jgi:hypothetical protein
MRRPVDGFFRNEEQYAAAALAGWAGHPALPSVVERRRVAAETTTMLFERYLADQVQVLRFCCRIFDISFRYPDGSEEPNPFDPQDPEGWPLSPAERAAAGRSAADFRAVVTFTASDLVQAGVPLDPGWDGDRVIIAELLLLPRAAGHAIPWSDAPAVLAARLQPPGISAVYRDGRTTTSRDGRSERAAINIDRIRRDYRARQGARALPMPYAGGQPRKAPRQQARRDALRTVRARFPDASVALILQTYDYSAQTPGGYLRTLLAERPGAPQPKPSPSTLHADLSAPVHGRQAPGENPSS